MASGGSTVLESIAMRFACQKVNQFKILVDVIECDSKTLTDGLNSLGVTSIYCEVMMDDIKDLALQMGCKRLSLSKEMKIGSHIMQFEVQISLVLIILRHT